MVGYSDVLIGLQNGDEGKARIIDQLAEDYDIIARFGGGPNAWHTIQKEQRKIALHQIPSGVFYPDKELYVGSGCVVNLEKLVAEMEELTKLDIDLTSRLHISSQATLIQPHHVLIDQEAGKEIGTTMNGIGPVYADRAMRIYGNRVLNIRLGDLVHDFDLALRQILDNLGTRSKLSTSDIRKIVDGFKQSFDKIFPFVEKDTLFLDSRVRNGKNVLFEGAQSFMLDVVKGTVPYVTSSQTVAGHAYVGGDLSPRYHRKVIGVAKAIMSRVGNGPFVSELGGKKSEKYCMEEGGRAHVKSVESSLAVSEMLLSQDEFEVGIALRVLGDEYGASTGRPRRMGILDLVQLAYAVRINGVDDLYLNKCDRLRDFSDSHIQGIPVVTDYLLEGRAIDYVPGSSAEYCRVMPSRTVFPGFNTSISERRTTADIPKELKHLLTYIEDRCGCKIKGIGVGPVRDQFIHF